MTLINHHPGPGTLARHAAGTLEPGAMIAVAAHLDRCPLCRRRQAGLEAVGGVLLDAAEPTLMAPDALARVLAMIDGPLPEPKPPATAPRLPRLPDGIELPPSLRCYDFGPWRWLAPGLHWSKADTARSFKGTVALFHVGAGRMLPSHSHSSNEYTQVIAGAFSDQAGHYRAGDFLETDEAITHQPVADANDDCLCLIVMEGPLRPRGLIARLMQPFLGF